MSTSDPDSTSMRDVQCVLQKKVSAVQEAERRYRQYCEETGVLVNDKEHIKSEASILENRLKSIEIRKQRFQSTEKEWEKLVNVAQNTCSLEDSKICEERLLQHQDELHFENLLRKLADKFFDGRENYEQEVIIEGIQKLQAANEINKKKLAEIKTEIGKYKLKYLIPPSVINDLNIADISKLAISEVYDGPNKSNNLEQAEQMLKKQSESLKEKLAHLKTELSSLKSGRKRKLNT